MEEPWTVVGRSGRRPGFPAAGSRTPGSSPGSPVYFHTPTALQAALSVHLHALSRNSQLVSSLWRHLQAWHAGLSLPAGAGPGLVCVGLGSVSCHGPSGSPTIQLSLLLLLQRLAASLAAPAALPSAEALGREVEGSCSSEGSGLLAPAVEAVDPCFTALDVALLGSVGVRALAQPWAGLPSGAAGPAILFMPHCAGTLYTTALASFAWVAGGEGQAAEPATLPQACLIGNCFRDYVERRQRSAAAEEAPPAWGPGLRQAVLESTTASSGAAAGSIEDRLPPYALDALVAVYHRCCSSPSQGAEGPVWRLQCTQLEPLVAPSARGEGPGTGTAYSQALSSTAVHTVEWLQAGE